MGDERPSALAEDILRGEEEFLESVFQGERTEVGRRVRRMVLISVPCLAAYGLSMGLYGWPWQAPASAVKIPLLFYSTLLATFPLLYVGNVLIGSKIGLLGTFALTQTAVARAAILLAAFAPITAIFAVTSSAVDGYRFLQLLHFAVCSFAGVFGLAAMYRSLAIACDKSEVYPPVALRLLKVWILVFAFTGVQLGWSMRPYLGRPSQDFELWRSGQYPNIYINLMRVIRELAGK